MSSLRSTSHRASCLTTQRTMRARTSPTRSDPSLEWRRALRSAPTAAAMAAATAANLPALADDSGLSVFALNGAPGIYSARWGGPGKDFNLAMKRVNEELETKSGDDRSAEFVCVLTLAWPDGHMETFRGTVQGDIVWPQKGERGFGYDPIFQAEGMTQTFAEIEPTEKHAMSHRADAFKQMVDACFG